MHAYTPGCLAVWGLGPAFRCIFCLGGYEHGAKKKMVRARVQWFFFFFFFSSISSSAPFLLHPHVSSPYSLLSTWRCIAPVLYAKQTRVSEHEIERHDSSDELGLYHYAGQGKPSYAGSAAFRVEREHAQRRDVVAAGRPGSTALASCLHSSQEQQQRHRSRVELAVAPFCGVAWCDVV